MKAILIGDAHIGKIGNLGKSGLGNTLNSRVQDQIKLLDWCLDQAILNDVFTIIMTGDVFETNNPSAILYSLFIDWLKRCLSHNIDVHIILGNHELIKCNGNIVSSALDVIERVELDNVHVYKFIDTVHFDDVSFTLMPFRDRRAMNCETTDQALDIIKNQVGYEFAEIPQNNLKVVIGHYTLEGALPLGDEKDIGDVSVELVLKPEVFNGYDYVWFGHIHKPQLLTDSNCRIAHIGSLDISDFGKGELEVKKIIVLFDTEDPVHFKELVVPTRNLYKIPIVIPIDKKDTTTDYVLEFLENFNKEKLLKDAIIRLEVKLPTREAQNTDREKIINYIYNDLSVHNISNYSETRMVNVVSFPQNSGVHNEMNLNTAVKLWADNFKFENDEIKNEFISEINEVIRINEENTK